MKTVVEFDDVVASVPALFGAVWSEQSMTREQFASQLAGIGLAEELDPDDEDEVTPYWRIRVNLSGADDAAGCERRLRTAISRQVGTPVGSDKHWDLGAFDVTIRIRNGRLELAFQAKLSLAAVRAAARDWLSGADGEPWLLTHGLIDPGVPPKETGFWPKPAGITQRPTARMFPDGRVHVQLFLDPSVQPPGRVAKSDDDAYRATLTYLEESLGQRDDPNPIATPVWTHGARVFTFSRMRSSTRSVEFMESSPSAESPKGRH